MDEEHSPDNNGKLLPDLKLDARQAQGFISFFKTLPNDARAVRFFDRKDYYTVHGENASFIAKTYYRTTTALRQLGNANDGISSVSVSRNMFENIARDLLLDRTDHTIEVYEGSGSNWRLTKAGTPGNIGSFEDVLFANNDMQDAPVTIALFPSLRENQCTVGLSYVDLTNQKLGLAEFLDDSQFTNVESVLVALGCKECLLPMESGKSIEFKNLHDVLSRCGVLLTERKKTEFKSRDLVQDLSRIIRGSIEPVRELLSEFQLALSALGALLSYVDLLADDCNYGNYTIQKYSLDRYMRLDSAAIRALNILESKTDANKNFSLLGLMNRTCTAGMGKRLLNRWLKQPLLDVDEVNFRLDMVQTFVDDVELRQTLRQQLKRMPDIERLTHNLRKRAANLSPVIKLYQACNRLPYIKSALEHYEGQFSPLIRKKYICPLQHWLGKDQLNMFIDLVDTAVDVNHIESGEYMISPGYDEALALLKDKLDAVEQQIYNLHKETANDLDLSIDKFLKLEKGSQFGHVFRITKKEEQKVRKTLNTHFIVLETRKDGVKFTNTKLKKLGDQYQKILNEYTSRQKDLVLRVVDTSATFSMIFEDSARLLSELDVLLSFADLTVSSPVPYVRPEITGSDEGDIILEGCRHPCVEAQDGVNFIPNDCNLVRGKSWLQIITGPNMGGKSTFIRQVGVNVLMAQIGCFVPCERASVSVRDCIFARVGAGDCQLRGVSTFMQEMLETASILKGATEKSLIIIDELGRGTSTYDGFGLAWAICEYLVQVTRAPTLFATHFHELTALSHGTFDDSSGMAAVGVANYHVGAHIDPSSRKLTMLYKVEPGACDQSFGIHVAEFANFPESVVALAKRKAAELENSAQTPTTSDKFNGEPGAKRIQVCNPDEMTTGAARARRFLEEFAKMPLDQMDVEQAMQNVSRLASELEKDAAKNAWLKQLFLTS
ncbi:DNA mismatch repair protein MSH2 isoform X1 [Dendrobium catenatum]|uniref:DNA mismatch repair protein MSH2 n=1 Tax=Dendrobium catenatum TaxID=906689 RepID=A0A2I0VQ17_9ASPA|nr:DNA mismatch repair protein MSH2 isoform X1 [Dendrobium catenatum]PKU65497.1 DNA mismatch repair protein MSH2 [Dendrobium catenatum]